MNQSHPTTPDLHPLHLLDQFLLTLDHNTSNTQKVIHVAEFLYGNPGTKRTSILEGALELLDQSTEPNLSHLAPVRLVIERYSRRCIFIVRGSQQHRRGSRANSTGDTEYMCTIGVPSDSKETLFAAGNTSYYCSCRSFFEKMKSDHLALCKHLMAVRLAQFLDGGDGRIIFSEQEVEPQEWVHLYTQLCMGVMQLLN